MLWSPRSLPPHKPAAKPTASHARRHGHPLTSMSSHHCAIRIARSAQRVLSTVACQRRGSGSMPCVLLPHEALTQSHTSKSIGRQGIGSLYKEFLCFNTMPFRHMPLLVHFCVLAWLRQRAARVTPLREALAAAAATAQDGPSAPSAAISGPRAPGELRAPVGPKRSGGCVGFLGAFGRGGKCATGRFAFAWGGRTIRRAGRSVSARRGGSCGDSPASRVQYHARTFASG